MLPPIPDKLSKIDSVTVSEHFFLEESDACFYVWEYTPRKGYAAGPTNQFIKNLKIKPGEIARSSSRRRYKETAIDHAADALRTLLGRETAEGDYSFVPVPCSKAVGHPEHDVRLHEVLRRAFGGWRADVQPILQVRNSARADHESTDRMSYDVLLDITEINPPAAKLGPTIVVVDDVLNSGKHFKVAKTLLSNAYPDAAILGIFLARCIRPRHG